MSRLLLITPARDEAAHLERTIRAVAAQTRRPDLWLVVDDGSTDATPRILDRWAAELPFLRVVQAPTEGEDGGADRLALAAEARAFNWALNRVDLGEFSHLGKLDADIELPPEYFERLLQSFAREPGLGVAGGGLLEQGRGGWYLTKVPAYHVRGALKLYSRECFEAIGGIEERLGWDTIDETYARMNGFATRSLRGPQRPPPPSGRHPRRNPARPRPPRPVRLHPSLQRLVGGAALVQGRLLAPVRALRTGLLLRLRAIRGERREERVEDERFRRFVAQELRSRARLGNAVAAQNADRGEDAKVPTFFVRS